MRTTEIVGTCLIALLAVAPAMAGEAAGSETFGEKLSEGLELTPIAEIVAEPDAWSGRRVRVAGEVSGVCSKQGCWMDLRSPQNATLRVKVEDGVIVFPQDAVGRQAEAEGEVEVLEMERDKYEAWLRHVAEEEGREFDAAEVGAAPYRIVRLRGSGARIAAP